MKFLVLGCNGMAGHMISLYLKEQGHDVLGFARKKSALVDSVVGDVMDTDYLRRVVESGRFDFVINCVGILNRAAEDDKAAASWINAYLPHWLAKITENIDTRIIHMSTDCVFSGKRGGYTEKDVRDGDLFYDRSKALGELDDGRNLTLRCSIVGPDINPCGIGLFNWFMRQTDTVNGFTKAIWTGQTTLQLAKTVEAAAKARAHGLINMVPSGSISKYDLLCLFNRYFKGSMLQIIPYDVPMPDKSLIRTVEGFAWNIPDYETMIAELAVWMKAHKELYPHYAL